jgi:ABC-type transport system involved in cytochrome bd biosynthesis fused ATPase/permease subunit
MLQISTPWNARSWRIKHRLIEAAQQQQQQQQEEDLQQQQQQQQVMLQLSLGAAVMLLLLATHLPACSNLLQSCCVNFGQAAYPRPLCSAIAAMPLLTKCSYSRCRRSSSGQ